MPIPVTLIAGFLGSGKTTLLRRILLNPAPSERFAVIVNEFGALGIDGDWILRKDTEQSSLVELANGCICCEIQGDLREAVLELTRNGPSPGNGRAQVGRSKHGWASRLLARAGSRRREGPTHILIEASGAASPGPAVQTFLVDDELRQRATLGGVVTMVHAGLIESQLASTAEAGPQVAYADRVVVGHGDRTDDEGTARAIQVVRCVNPLAEVRAATHGDVDLPWLLRGGGGRLAAAAVPFSKAAHTPGLSSVSLTAEGPVDPGALRMWLEFLAKRRTGELMRCKGILRAKGGGVLLVQGVYQWLEVTVEASEPSAESVGDSRSRLVLIGKDLDAEEIERGWQAIRADP